MARETWTDERLDDLQVEMKEGFNRVEADVREVKGEVRDLRSEMNGRFDSMQRTMILGFVSIVASIAASVIGGILATQL